MKKFLTALVASVVSLAPTGVMANEADGNRYLLNSIRGVGVTVLFNDSEFCDGQNAGAYSPYQRVMIVCQDNARVANGREIPNWTANDYDTVRHEAHHIVQDCWAGVIGDGDLGNIFETEQELYDFLKLSKMSERQFDRIVNTYRKNGASNEIILLELEAFAVADGVDPYTIGKKLTETCKVPF